MALRTFRSHSVEIPLGVNGPQDSNHPMAEAARWVSQITAVGVEIVACVWLGNYLDAKLGTSFCSLIGSIVGPLLGFWHLLLLVGVFGGKPKKSPRKDDGSAR